MKKLTYLSKKAKVLALAGALALAGTTTGCGSKEEPIVEISTEITTEETTEDIMVENVTDKIDLMEQNVVSLTNGQLLTNGVFEITENNKKDKAELITNAYITFNINEIDARTLGMLNQNGELDSTKMTNDYMIFTSSLSSSIAISNEENRIDVSSLFEKDAYGEIKDKNDYEYLKNYTDIVVAYNQAVKDGNNELAQQKLSEIIAIKEEIITEPNVIQDINPQTLFVVADSMLLISGVITEEDTMNQIVNSIEEACQDKITTNGEVDNTMNTEASQGSYESRFLSLTDDMVKSKLEQSHAFLGTNANYSYSVMIERIVSQIDLTKYSGINAVEEYVRQENEIQQQISDNASNEMIGTTTTVVQPNEVPEEVRIETTETITDTEGNVVELTETEYQEAWNAGNAKAVEDYNSNTRSDNNSISGKSAKWNEVYNKSYNQTYDGLVKDAADFRRGYEAGSIQATTDYSMGIRNTNPVVEGESSMFNNAYVQAYNITYDNLVSENSLTSSIEQLKQLKSMIYETYAEAYEATSDDVKKM